MSALPGTGEGETGPTLGDPLGIVLRRFMESADRDVTPLLIERDDGLIETMAPKQFLDEPSGPTADWVLERVRGRVLDIGAGAGRFAIPLQTRGRAVTALDVSEGALDVCRSRGIEDLFLGTVEELRSANERPQFDTLLLMGNNLGLLGDDRAAARFLDALRALCAEDGIVLAEGMDALATEDPRHRAYHRRNAAMGRPRGLVRFRVRAGNVVSPWMEYRWPAFDDVAALLAANSWEIRAELRDGAQYVVELAPLSLQRA